jgi:hypothetical protein
MATLGAIDSPSRSTKRVRQGWNGEVITQPASFRSRRMTGGATDILLAFLTLSLPMVAFSSVLIALVFYYRITQATSGLEHLRVPGVEPYNELGGAYYVDINATTLVFIASWSSSLAPILVGATITLYSFPVAKDYLRRTQSGTLESLLTPYQLSILLRFINGSPTNALWNWLKYLVFWNGKRQKQSPALKRVALLTILAIFLAFVVLAADTWLHITTKTVPLLHTWVESSSSNNYSMSLRASCVNSTFTKRTDALEKCALYRSVSGAVLYRPFTVNKIYNNISDEIRVRRHANLYAYLAPPPTESLAARDYTAHTFAITTNCTPVTKLCNLTIGQNTTFYCSESWRGDLTNGICPSCDAHWQPVYFNDSTKAFNLSYQSTGVGNPFYYGLAAAIGRSGGPNNDSELITSRTGAVNFVLDCTSTVYDVNYDSINGTVTRFDAKPSNESVTNLFQGSGARTGFATEYLYLKQAAWLSIQQHTAVDLANQMAMAFSISFATLGAANLNPSAAINTQVRTTSLVTRLPVGPFYLLVGANLMFTVLGCILAIYASCANRGEDTCEVQSRLSIEGIVANYLEGEYARLPAKHIEDLFVEKNGQESSRVILDRSRLGGFSMFQVQ